MNNSSKLYTCMSCGFMVFEEVFSEYEGCPICDFQDNFGAIEDPTNSYFMGSGSLIEQQQSIFKIIPINIMEFNQGGTKYLRNPLWKTLNIDKFNKKHIYFPKFKFEEFKEKYPKHYDYFEKHMIEAQKYNSDEKIHLEK